MAVPTTSRFQVVNTPILAPGTCFVCRSNSGGPFIDTGLSHIWYTSAPDVARDGAVYICSACITEMAANLAISNVDIGIMAQNARNDGIREGINRSIKSIEGYVAAMSDAVTANDPEFDAGAVIAGATTETFVAGAVDDEPTVEIGGQVMTQSQFDAARFPLIENKPDNKVANVTTEPDKDKTVTSEDITNENVADAKVITTESDKEVKLDELTDPAMDTLFNTSAVTSGVTSATTKSATKNKPRK